MNANRWLNILSWSLWFPAAGACHSHTGGDEGNGGSAGSNELVPATSNVFVTQFRQTAASKVDLLFMVDNSESMADKQRILAQAVPHLANRLLNPLCVDNARNATAAQPTSPDDDCVEGARELPPVADMHIGIISSSLGGVGGPFCEASGTDDWNATMNDMAHLIGTVRALEPPASEGFLNWDNRDPVLRDSDSAHDAEPIADLSTLMSQFTDHVLAPGERGCEFEASLESWYRFLIDPAPYEQVVIANTMTSQGQKAGVDQSILDQRAMFLRSDSLLVVVMLTDENDCSIKASGLGNLVTTLIRNGSQFLMRRGTSVCDTSPNDPCCLSCATSDSAWPAGCSTKDELCRGPDGSVSLTLTEAEDPLSLRCFQQKQRFGIDLLYPTSRYSVGLKSSEICPDSTFDDGDCSCAEATRLGVACEPGSSVINPLYGGGSESGFARTPDSVFLAGIVGVPWWHIATEDTASADTPDLRYKTAVDIDWAELVGAPDTDIPPISVYMRESVTPRDGLPGPDSEPTADPINGHEWNTAGSDLQYACVFDLPTPRDCTTVDEGESCDCRPSASADASPTAEVEAAKSPLCQDASGQYTTTQYRAKAFPGLRQIEVLQDYGDNAIVASICPKTLTGAPTDPSYGYNPAMNAIVDRIKGPLSTGCLARALATDEETYLVPCHVVEVLPEGACSCDPSRGRVDLSDEPGLVGGVRAALKESLACDSEAHPQSCDSYCMCEIGQYGVDLPADRDVCLHSTAPAPSVSVPGYCYIDVMDPSPSLNVGNPDLVADCQASQRRRLRFLGDDTPAAGALTFIACTGERTR